MTRDKMRFSAVGTDIIAYNVSEGNTITASNYVFTPITLDTAKYATLVPVTNELINDTAYDLFPEVINSTAIGFAKAEDTAMFTALKNAASATANPQVATSIAVGLTAFNTFFDMIGKLGAVNVNYLANAKWLMHPTTWAVIQKIAPETYQMINPFAAVPNTLLGYEVILSNVVDNATATAAGNVAVVFGNFEHVYFGNRQEMDIYVAKEGTIGSDSLLEKDCDSYGQNVSREKICA